MGLKRKQMLMGQKAYFEQKLQDRLSFLSGKGIETPKAAKDTLLRKLKANIKAIDKRVKFITDNEKRAEEMVKIKAERAAAPQKEQEGDKGEKPKKAAAEGKGKKIKAETKAAPPKTTEGGKAPMKKKAE
jgi:ethanolamine utilization cobalamin adenosyltransferase